ncbi:hypothetical protein GTO89_12110 [Heliobacterium gestii]|uniref:Peptidase C39-like domain-containing protein n=2 Tax=Heliomicrobium gestii TaxID=2699 RepID=A0A845LC77_HELGE|nr:hypothetical protein [Heliomicrobium gestii]
MLAAVLLGLVYYLLTPFPSEDVTAQSIPTRYHVPREAAYEVQGHNQCSAFSTAYLLRTLGKDAEGARVYSALVYKIPFSGYVLPKGIMSYLQAQGMGPSIYRGALPTLKARLTQGNPVITLVGNGVLWQHYMTLVGYDEEKRDLYFFDSKRETDENSDLPGNRTLTEEYFLSMWDNGLPLFHHIYITAGERP